MINVDDQPNQPTNQPDDQQPVINNQTIKRSSKIKLKSQTINETLINKTSTDEPGGVGP